MSSEKEKNFVSAVVYIHNNEAVLESFLNDVYSSLDKLVQEFEIICVDDASTDRSKEIVRTFAASKKHSISLVHMGFLQGTELSLTAGEDLAIGDFVYEFEQPLKVWPDDMMEQVYRKMQEGYDIVSACPLGKSKLSSKLFYSIFNRYSNLSAEIGPESFRLLSRRAINRVAAMTNAQIYKKAANVNSGLRQASISFPTEMGSGNRDKTGKERRSIAMNSLILFTDIGYKIAFVMAIIMLVFAAAVGIYTVVIYATGHPVEGWTPIMVFLAIGFFVLFIILTFVIKYLSLILHLNFRRQRYVIQDVEKV